MYKSAVSIKLGYSGFGNASSSLQLVSETRQAFTDSPGVEYFDYDYKREGVLDLFMIAEPLAGKRQVLMKSSHDRFCWA